MLDQPKPQTHRLKAELLIWLETHKSKGSIILRYLIKYANQPVHVTFLDYNVSCKRPLEKWAEYPEAAAYGLISLMEDMKMADYRTVAECLQESKRLLAMIAACGDLNDYHGMEKHQHDLEQIYSYLNDIKKPNGPIKSFPPSWDGCYHMVYSNVNRLFAKLREEDFSLYAYANKNLSTGQWYMWREPPLVHRNSAPSLMYLMTSRRV